MGKLPQTRSPYFEWMTKTKIKSQVICNAGTIAVLPKVWAGKLVNIRYQDRTDQHDVLVHQNSSRTFVLIPHIYCGQKVYITLSSS